MKTIMIAALLLQAPADRWFAADKIKHFFLSAFVQSISYSALRAGNADHRSALLGATGVTMAVGITKELRDRSGTRFSTRDLVWDAAGACTFTLILDHSIR